MILNHKKYGDNGSCILIIHGIFGSLDNWHTVAQILGKSHQVYTLDMRNHGYSPHTDTMSFNEMAQDIKEFMTQQDLSKCVLMGHSMGGKVAMQFALNFPKSLEKLIVVDIAPKAYSAAHNPYFSAYKEISFSAINSRKELDEAFKHYETNDAVRLFLMKNIVSDGTGAYKLKINIVAIEKSYQEIVEALQLHQIDVPSLFIAGDRSSYIKKDDKISIQQYFSNVKFATIANAGHWVHAENNVDFVAAVNNFMS